MSAASLALKQLARGLHHAAPQLAGETASASALGTAQACPKLEEGLHLLPLQELLQASRHI